MSLTLGAICIAPAVRFQSLVRTCGQNGHMETVLVVDDEPTCRVRKFIRPFSGASGGGSRIFELGFSFPIWRRALLLVSLVYLLFRRALAVAALRVRSREFKELEIVVLR